MTWVVGKSQWWVVYAEQERARKAEDLVKKAAIEANAKIDEDVKKIDAQIATVLGQLEELRGKRAELLGKRVTVAGMPKEPGQAPTQVNRAQALQLAWQRLGVQAATASEKEAWEALSRAAIPQASVAAWHKKALAEIEQGVRCHQQWCFFRDWRALQRQARALTNSGVGHPEGDEG
jgi:hypothetical protein